MKPYKILSVVGARPQFIKAAPLSKAIAASDNLTEVLVHTGQHYDYALSQQFFDELGLPTPQYNLEIGSGRHAYQMGQILIKLDAVLEKEKPDMVVVFGDTNSTAAAAITAAKNNIPLAHVEAGLREWNKRIPEEINKMLTDAVTDLYFPPTQTGVDNLKKQGVTEGVYLVGDIGMDLIINNLDKIERHKNLLEKLSITEGSYFFMTCHRAGNTDDVGQLEQILSIFDTIKEPIIFPIHPRTKNTIEKHGLQHYLEKKNVVVLEPIGFWDTQVLIQNAKMVLTDSGGVIKEAYFHRVPCLILQKEIEWIEAVREGWAKLVGSQSSDILSGIRSFERPTVWSGFLGDGRTATRIVNIISHYLKNIDQ
ncbi:MAG: UDP-N-acetylglucosamine 2-epimerase (non-hydrolyzing) [Saprospiraceae bacterium]|nr:UDP-N-acetylglucosamine 2-epimerase (non-hydrolyzing) [Saprospiraceae bacterium]